MTLRQYCIRDFPTGCGPNPNSTPSAQPRIDNDDNDYEPFEDLDDFTQKGHSESEKPKFGIGLKRPKVYAIRDFPPGCRMNVSSYDYDRSASVESEPEEEEVIMEDEVLLSSQVGDSSNEQHGYSESKKPMFVSKFGFGLKRPRVFAIRAFPPGCGTNVSSDDYDRSVDVEREPEEVIMEDEVQLSSQVSDSSNVQHGYSELKKPMFGSKFGFELKRPEVCAMRDFPPGCGTHVSSNDSGYLADDKYTSCYESEPEEEEVIMEDGVPLSSTVSDWAVDMEVGLFSGRSEFGFVPESERKMGDVVVLGLMATQLCPWNMKSKDEKKVKKLYFNEMPSAYPCQV